MTEQIIQPIETYYRGHRFRSRLEARWAVFMDAAGIEWQYESEGFRVNGAYYLPDFWLPKLKTFVEVKPDEESAQAAVPILRNLATGMNRHGVVFIGIPDVPLPKLISVNGFAVYWCECSFCNGAGFTDIGTHCMCPTDVEIITPPAHRCLRIIHAMMERRCPSSRPGSPN
jgi:hypothetical protein